MHRIIGIIIAHGYLIFACGFVSAQSNISDTGISLHNSQGSDQQNLADQTASEVMVFGKSKKYVKRGTTVVFLTGSPREIGYAHGKLLSREIREVNEPFFESFNRLDTIAQAKWMEAAKKLEEHIPEEYVEEIHGIAEGSGLDYNKVLFLNTLTTLSEANACFAFSFRGKDARILTGRQIDSSSHMYKKMILYIVKPRNGSGFAAMLNPGWIDGETGMNEKGVTVSQNNIGIRQKVLDVMPITHLTRHMLQYSKTPDDVEKVLSEQRAFPARLVFVSSSEGAYVFEIANDEKAKIGMRDGFLAVSNHARQIPSRDISSNSRKRLDFANNFLSKHKDSMNIEKAIALLRSSRISSSWRNGFQNRQSFLFSPNTLDFWIAIPPKSNSKPASYGPYVGFNLLYELYGTGQIPHPVSFPARN
jgi:predicted choloylglycine hydrolase